MLEQKEETKNRVWVGSHRDVSSCGGESLKISIAGLGYPWGAFWWVFGAFCLSVFLLLPGKSQMPGALEGVCHQHAGRGQDL